MHKQTPIQGTTDCRVSADLHRTICRHADTAGPHARTAEKQIVQKLGNTGSSTQMKYRRDTLHVVLCVRNRSPRKQKSHATGDRVHESLQDADGAQKSKLLHVLGLPEVLRCAGPAGPQARTSQHRCVRSAGPQAPTICDHHQKKQCHM